MKFVETIAYVLDGIVIYEIVLTNMFGAGNVEIWSTCKGNCAGSEATMHWCP